MKNFPCLRRDAGCFRDFAQAQTSRCVWGRRLRGRSDAAGGLAARDPQRDFEPNAEPGFTTKFGETVERVVQDMTSPQRFSAESDHNRESGARGIFAIEPQTEKHFDC